MHIFSPLKIILTYLKKRAFQKALVCSSFMFTASFVIATNGGELSNKSTAQNTQTLIVAGGCFWCVEADFDIHPGVLDVVSGYIGGNTDNPTYKEVTFKNTGHYEAAKITFDTDKTSVQELTEYFWKTIDPVDPKGQFCDKGHSYKTALFYQSDAQKTVFDQSLEQLQTNKSFHGDITTVILPAGTFYPAEDYHQNYKKKNPLRYYYYRTGCGRDARIKQLWGEVASKDLKDKKKG